MKVVFHQARNSERVDFCGRSREGIGCAGRIGHVSTNRLIDDDGKAQLFIVLVFVSQRKVLIGFLDAARTQCPAQQRAADIRVNRGRRKLEIVLAILEQDLRTVPVASDTTGVGDACCGDGQRSGCQCLIPHVPSPPKNIGVDAYRLLPDRQTLTPRHISIDCRRWFKRHTFNGKIC